MAENAANFTQTFQNNPSIFEVLAQKTLNDTLHPAVQKLALFLFHSNPRKFRWLDEHFEEAFLVLNGLLQYYYLKYYDASFSENFYGLKRVVKDSGKLSLRHKKLSLVLLVVLPYFKRKLDEKLALYRLENAEGTLRKAEFTNFLKRFLLQVHAVFEVTYAGLHLVNYVNYMSKKSDSQLPTLDYFNMKLEYSNEALEGSGFWSALFTGKLSFSDLSVGLVRNAVSSTLEVAAFFLQFLQTWNAEKSNYSITALPTVQSPPLDNRSKAYKGKCPLCLRPWINPTVLQVSGYIFCFRCILLFLNENRRCPITNLPAKPLQIVRLYIND